MEKRYITDNSLKAWLTQLIHGGKQLYAPILKGKNTDFKVVKNVDEISLSHIQTTQSAKNIAFPRTEKLFSFTKKDGDIELDDYDISMIPETVVFGLHPCDAVGFNPLSSILNWDTPDTPYNERFKRTTLVSMSCSKSDEYCFCTSVNGSPGNTTGSDILLTKVDEGYLAEILTEKGIKLIENHNKLFETDPNIDKEQYLAKIPVRFSLDQVKEKISNMFESEVWKHQSERCIGCGACAFVCPTCACFDIQEDVVNSEKGNRLRCWDSCGFALFTLHTSGHNPRETQSKRWRQRLLHKFSYMPERLAVTGCTGCGRCSRACPVDMNICEHLTEISEL